LIRSRVLTSRIGCIMRLEIKLVFEWTAPIVVALSGDPASIPERTPRRPPLTYQIAKGCVWYLRQMFYDIKPAETKDPLGGK